MSFQSYSIILGIKQKKINYSSKDIQKDPQKVQNFHPKHADDTV